MTMMTIKAKKKSPDQKFVLANSSLIVDVGGKALTGVTGIQIGHISKNSLLTADITVCVTDIDIDVQLGVVKVDFENHEPMTLEGELAQKFIEEFTK